MTEKYQNKPWLHEQYIKNNRSSTDMAQECGVTSTTILSWLDKHGIERRSQQEAHKPDQPYTEKDWLQAEYIEKGRSMADIASECDVSAAVVLKWLRRYEIETRDATDFKKLQPAQFLTTRQGYEVSRSKFNGYMKRVGIHRLVAIADGANPNDVFSGGEYHAHHKNGIRWDNRPSNIELKRGAEHIREHSEQRERADTGEWL